MLDFKGNLWNDTQNILKSIEGCVFYWEDKSESSSSSLTHDCDIDGLVQDCSNSSALAMELLQSCTKPLI